MSQEIAVRSPGLEIASLADAEKMAAKFAESSLIPNNLKGKAADIMVMLVTGHELGLSPMQSLRAMHVINGRPVLSAELIVGLIKRSSACQFFRLVESTDEIATYETQRTDEPQATRLTWTIDQAKKAGLNGDNWRKHPAAMLRARCSAALGRAVYPDVMLGVMEQNEAEEVYAGKAQMVEPIASTVSAPAEDVTDAEVVEPEDTEADWLERIAGAADEAGLRSIGAELARQYPEGHPIRAAVKGAYASKQRELRS